MAPPAHDDPHTERLWTLVQWVLGIAFSLIITLTGLVVGLWSRSVEQSLTDIKDEHRDVYRTLNAHADLPNRTSQLESETTKLELRIFELERRVR